MTLDGMARTVPIISSRREGPKWRISKKTSANRYADRAKDQEPKLNRDEFHRLAREEAKRQVGPIRGPKGEERWTETEEGPLHFS